MESINKTTKPANIKQTTKILEQMKNCICKIYMSGKENGTGFFTRFSYNNQNFLFLITNYHIINEDYMDSNNSIKISLNDEQEIKMLPLNDGRIIYFSKQYDATIIEIKEKDNIDNYLEIEDNLFIKNSQLYYEKKSIYILQYKDVALVSHGILKEINNHDIIHYCPTESGSSGAPILNLTNNKVIGIHKHSSNNQNKGTFLLFPINDFINQKINKVNDSNETKKEKDHNRNNENKNETVSEDNPIKNIISYNNNETKNEKNKVNNNETNDNNNNENNAISSHIDDEDEGEENIAELTDKTNEIIIQLDVPRKDVNNKNIYFLDNAGIYKDGKYHYNEHIKQLNAKNTELYINDVKYNFQKYFLAKKEGKYIVKLKLKTLLTDCSYIFGNCKFITEIDLSNLETKNVTSMKRMFYDSINISKINLNSIDTNNVTNMECMFGNCKNLKSIDLSSFDTRNVTNMKNMFNSCKLLENIDLSNFNTNNVTNMASMFYGCDNLLNVNISSFNTSNVKNMSNMFDGCHKLAEINLTSFNTKNVTTMEKMFNCCYNIVSLNFSSFDFKNVTNINNIFYGCDSLKQVKANNHSSEIIKKEVDPNNRVKIIII